MFIEPLIEQIKSVFKIDPVTVGGFDKVRGILWLSIFLHQIFVYYNRNVVKNDDKEYVRLLVCLSHS